MQCPCGCLYRCVVSRTDKCINIVPAPLKFSCFPETRIFSTGSPLTKCECQQSPFLTTISTRCVKTCYHITERSPALIFSWQNWASLQSSHQSHGLDQKPWWCTLWFGKLLRIQEVSSTWQQQNQWFIEIVGACEQWFHRWHVSLVKDGDEKFPWTAPGLWQTSSSNEKMNSVSSAHSKISTQNHILWANHCALLQMLHMEQAKDHDQLADLKCWFHLCCLWPIDGWSSHNATCVLNHPNVFHGLFFLFCDTMHCDTLLLCCHTCVAALPAKCVCHGSRSAIALVTCSIDSWFNLVNTQCCVHKSNGSWCVCVCVGLCDELQGNGLLCHQLLCHSVTTLENWTVSVSEWCSVLLHTEWAVSPDIVECNWSLNWWSVSLSSQLWVCGLLMSSLFLSTSHQDIGSGPSVVTLEPQLVVHLSSVHGGMKKHNWKWLCDHIFCERRKLPLTLCCWETLHLSMSLLWSQWSMKVHNTLPCLFLLDLDTTMNFLVGVFEKVPTAEDTWLFCWLCAKWQCSSPGNSS